jgi:hypothetical protein
VAYNIARRLKALKGLTPYESKVAPSEGKMTLTGLFIFLLIGAVAGSLAGLLMRSGGFDRLGDIVVGVSAPKSAVGSAFRLAD